MPTFTLPVIRANVESGGPVTLGAAMVAAWSEYWAMIGRGELAASETPPDDRAFELIGAALDESLTAFIEIRALFGDLAEDERFRKEYLTARRALIDSGVHAMLDALLG